MRKSDIIGAGFAAAILIGAMEEDQFPAIGCAWIEPIRVDVD